MRLGVDIGGTKTAAVVLGDDGEVLAKATAPSGRGAADVVAQATHIARLAMAEVGGPAANLPAVKQVVAYGHLDPEVGVTATAEASDAKSATKIADVLRGFSAMLSLQSGQRAELQQIADSISVATEDDKVHVKATITHELIESLKKSAISAHAAHKAAEVQIH